MSNEKLNKEGKVEIGKLIKEQFLQSKLSIDDFAGSIGCNRDNVYDIFRRERINTDQLLKISKTLDFDFFKVYSEQVINEKIIQIEITINIPKEEMDKGNICKYCGRNRSYKEKSEI